MALNSYYRIFFWGFWILFLDSYFMKRPIRNQWPWQKKGREGQLKAKTLSLEGHESITSPGEPHDDQLIGCNGVTLSADVV